MASQAGKWREDQILIICPGSKTTLAQLGCSELTPPAYRIPTRMFKDEETPGWRPYHTEKRRRAAAAADGSLSNNDQQQQDTKKNDEDEWEYVEDPDSDEGATYPLQSGRIVNMEAFLAFLDHVHGMLTTTFHNTPIVLMASPQWTRPDCETITQYIFEKTKTPALCLIHSGVATHYGLKWPNMTVVDIGFEKVDVTCIYESRVVNQRTVGRIADELPRPSGGEVFTRRLLELLKDKGFNYDMAEQLKKSNICEVLPYAADHPDLMELPVDAPGTQASSQGVATAAATTTAPPSSAAAAAPVEAAKVAAEPSRAAGAADGAAVVDEEEDGTGADGRNAVDDDGVLDVANIVVSGQTREFLAKKEKEKQERAKKRGKDKDGQEGAGAKPVRLPNSKRTRNVFHYEEIVEEEVTKTIPAEPAAPSGGGTDGASKDVEMTDASAERAASENAAEAKEEGHGEQQTTAAETTTTTANEEAPKTEESNGQPKPEGEEGDAPKPEDDQAEANAEEKPKEDGTTAAPNAETNTTAAQAAPSAETTTVTERQSRRVRRDIEVGLERFLFADRAEIDRIVTGIYRTVQGIEDMYMRPACWENLVFVGNGARLRGLKDNIIQTLNARHLISPSTATMFTSELPSNLGTPSGTGSQTPTSTFAGSGGGHQLPTSSNVNPLLQAATTANLGAGAGAPGGGQGTPGGEGAGGQPSHHFHSQTPTAIKLAQLPTYLSEWSKHGFEEAMFLGAQVAARLAFCVHNLDAQGLEAQRMMSLSRVDYNELGPKGIRSHSMLG